MCPCGIVVLMQELFTAESKSQVYAALHELLSNYPSISQSLSMCCVLCNRAHTHCYILYLHALFRIYLLWWWLSFTEICHTWQSQRSHTHHKKASRNGDSCWQVTHARSHWWMVSSNVWSLHFSRAKQCKPLTYLPTLLYHVCS